MYFICLMFVVFCSCYSQDDKASSADINEEEVTKKDCKETRDSTIPVVDLSNYFNEESREQFIESVRDALHSPGFIAISNAGVNKILLDNFYNAMEEFFTKSKELKMEVEGSASINQRGYTSFGRSSAKGSDIVDFKEYFSMGPEVSKEIAEELGYWPNVWPEYMNIEEPAKAFYAHTEEFSILLQEIFAQALGEDINFLKDKFKNGDTSLRIIHYPVANKNNNEDQRVVWAEEHTDISAFTILPRATQEGLEMRNIDGEWIPVYVNEDTLIINCGDLLEAYSNGYFTSAVHRVLEPKHLKNDRYSTVMFVHPRPKETVYPLPRWIEKTGGKAKFINATREELLFERLADMGVASDYALKLLQEQKVMERLMTVNRASKEAMLALKKAGYASKEVLEKIESEGWE